MGKRNPVLADLLVRGLPGDEPGAEAQLLVRLALMLHAGGQGGGGGGGGGGEGGEGGEGGGVGGGGGGGEGGGGG